MQKPMTAVHEKKRSPHHGFDRRIEQQATGRRYGELRFFQQTAGNQAMLRLLRSAARQRKLTISRPDDIYEQEADRVAEQVMRMPDAGNYPATSEEGERRDAEPATAQHQSSTVNRLVIHRWEAGEHLELGEAAGVKEVIVHPGDPGRNILPYKIPFAEIGPFGDYYATLDDMRKEAETETGRRKLDYLRWQFRQEAGKAPGREPAATEDEKKQINTLYLQLAASNLTHFASGNRARDEYRKYHEQAIRGALLAGYSRNRGFLQEAMAKEAFGMHFYEDAFSSGHIRTPRADIKAWYDAKFPNAFDDFIEYIGTHMAEQMANEYATATVAKVRPEVMQQLRPMAAPYRGVFSLGDVISKAIHDAEGAGLSVVSQASPDSKQTGGYKWTSVGDGKLKDSQETKQLITTGIKESTAEVNKAFDLGAKEKPAGGDVQKIISGLVQKHFSTPYLPELLMPEPDPSIAAISQQYPWEWGKFNDNMAQILEASIRGGIIPQLQSIAKQVSATVVKDHWLTGRYEFHPRRAFEHFVAAFQSNPLGVLEAVVRQKCRR